MIPLDHEKLPSVYEDAAFRHEAESYAANFMKRTTAADLERAVADAYLDGAQKGVRIGFQLCDKRHERKEIERKKREQQ